MTKSLTNDEKNNCFVSEKETKEKRRVNVFPPLLLSRNISSDILQLFHLMDLLHA